VGIEVDFALAPGFGASFLKHATRHQQTQIPWVETKTQQRPSPKKISQAFSSVAPFRQFLFFALSI